jgi:putative PIN family toxin of toxin-antitoxin system
VTSPEIISEYLRVLQRPVITRKYGIPGPEVMHSVLDLVQSSIIVYPPPMPSACRDPNDDKFLAAAKAGDAAYVVSEDLDLLDLGHHEGIPILTAKAYLQVLSHTKG